MRLCLQFKLVGIDCFTYESVCLDIDDNEASVIEKLPKKIKWNSFIDNIPVGLIKRIGKQLQKELVDGKTPQYLKNFYAHKFKLVGVRIAGVSS